MRLSCSVWPSLMMPSGRMPPRGCCATRAVKGACTSDLHTARQGMAVQGVTAGVAIAGCGCRVWLQGVTVTAGWLQGVTVTAGCDRVV